ncbi:MAG: hypothetical protein M1837_002985 [Sclerophora amabilis]|nr:MAG: hypothetical protein M1837_002985 [Sclerophora amabilis]
MPSDLILQSPYSLLSLPSPPDAERGRFHTTSVWSIGAGGTRKRKRAEIAIGVDGEGVNTYNVQTSKAVTSHAISSQSYFTCPPCAVRQKDHGLSRACRLTYLSVLSPKPTIMCFMDSAPVRKKSSPATKSDTLKFSFSVANPHKRAILLETLPYGEAKSDFGILKDLLVVFDDGEICGISGDLKEKLWTVQLKNESGLGDEQRSSPSATIQWAAVTNARALRKGFFKDRQDILSLLGRQCDDTGQEWRALPVLMVMSKITDSENPKIFKRAFQLLSIRPRTQIGMRRKGSLQALFTSPLPGPGTDINSAGHISFSPSSGIVYELADGMLHLHNLSAPATTTPSRLSIARNASLSFLNLSGSLLLTTTSKEVNAYDLEYQALQASMAFSDASSIKPGERKRKLGQDVAKISASPIQLHSYLPRLDLAIGISTNQLVGIPVNTRLDESNRKKRRKEGRLLNSLGRGLGRPDPAPSMAPADLPSPLGQFFHASIPTADTQWRDQVSSMDRYVEAGDVDRFENVFAEAIGIQRAEMEATKGEIGSAKKANSTAEDSSVKINGITTVNGVHGTNYGTTKPTPTGSSPSICPNSSRPAKWKWSPPKGGRSRALFGPNVQLNKILYVLSKIFKWYPNTPRSASSKVSSAEGVSKGLLKIVFYPPNVFEWLVGFGSISVANIESAIRQRKTGPGLLWRLHPGQVIEALVNHDPGMGVLDSVFRSPTYFGVGELVPAIILLIRILSDQNSKSCSNEGALLTNGYHPKELTNGENSASVAIQGARVDQDHSISGQQKGNGIQERVLAVALNRLHSFSMSSITKTLRSQLKQDEIFSIISQLRSELCRVGSVATFPDGELELNGPQGDSQLKVTVLGNLLNAAIDCVGASGWLIKSVYSNGPNNTEDLISQTRHEVSVLLEGIEDTVYLEGLFAEMLRYEKSVVKVTPKKQNSATDVPIILQSQLQPDKLLPLGLEAVQDIPRTRIAAGGEIQTRTSRDIGQLKSKRVGKYSFEKIVI